MKLSITRAGLWLVFALIVSTGLFAPTTALTAPPVSTPIVKHHPHKPGELLVKFKAGVSDADIEASARSRGASAIEKFRRPKSLITSPLDGWRHVKFPPGVDTKGALEQFASDPLVERVELNYLISANIIPNDPGFSGQWGLHNVGQQNGIVDADIDAPEAWDIQTGSSAVVVAVIDSGVDFTHPDLSANMWINPGEIAGNGIDDDGNGYIDDVYGINAITGSGNPMDEYGHGTYVAGIIAAAGNNGIGIAGTSWNARIMAVKFMDAQGAGYTSDAIKSILYAINNGAKIINASWGNYSYSSALINAIQTANSAGVLFVASAGNDGSNNDILPYYPASSYGIPNVLSVAATDRFDNLGWLSNYGISSVHLGAPGMEILSTVQTTANACCYDPSGYKVASGTSAAAPFVAGSAALLLAKTSSLSAITLKAILMTTVDPLASLKGKTVTGGRLNVYNTLTCEPSKLLLQTETPAEGFTVYSGDATSIRAHLVTCNGPIANAVVSVTFSNGESAVTLYDDGAHGDGVAGDGLYANYWTPVNIGSLNVTVTATHSNFTTATQTRNGKIKSRVTYLHEAAPFQWINATVGTAYALSDESSVTIPIGFDFDFYGMIQNSITISSNGYLTFGGTTAPLNSSLPDVAEPNALISPFWDDLDPGVAGSVFTLLDGVAPNRRLTVAWVGIPHAGGTNPVTFEATLHEGSGDIIFQYQDTDFSNPAYDSGASATVGVEDMDGVGGTLFSFNQPIVASSSARRFYRSVASSEITYRISVNVSPIRSNTGFIAVDMIDGDGINNNRLKLIQFSTDSTLLGAPVLTGDASGSFIPGPALVGDAQFFNEISQATVFGNTISFLLKLTANGGYQPFPDTIALYLLDQNQLPYPTNDPLGTDSLIAFAIDNVQPAPMIFQSSYASATVETVGAPIANPGGPYSGVVGYPIQFNGSASYDPEGSPLTYAWNFGDGGVGTGVAPTHTYGAVGTYPVSLVVHDGGLRSMAVTTTAVIKANWPPVANAGPDKTVYEKAAATLDGSASSDLDGQIVSYAWSQAAGPGVALTGANTAIASFTAPQVSAQTILTFGLTVTDDKGESNTDTVNVTVLDLDADADGDGLPDVWETYYFGNLNQGPNGDPDGDGLTNLQEFREGSSPTVAAPPPVAVSSITAVPGDGQNTLGWMGVLGAAQYNLYWKTTPGVTKANSTKVAGISFPMIHSSLTNGVNYYYVITAANNTGESAISPEVSAKPGARVWGGAALIENDDSVAASTPQMAMDALGNATALWIQGGRSWANRYTVNGGWGVPALIETSTQPASDPRVAMDAYGNAMAIWRQSDGARNNLWSNYYQTGVGWGQPVLVEYYDGTYISQGEVGDVTSPQLAMNAAGLAVAVWLQQDVRFDSTSGYIVDTVYVNSFWPGVGWSGRRMIDATDIGPSYTPKAAVSANGAIVATWSRATSPNGLFLTSEFIYVNHFVVNTGWTGPVMLATNSNNTSIDLSEPNAALDGNGNPMVVWRETISAKSGTIYNIWSNRLNAGAWGTPTLLVSPNNKDYAAKPQVVMDASGNALVAWIQSGSAKGNRIESIEVKRYSVSGGWGGTASVGNDGYVIPGFSLNQDMQGDAMLVWWQLTGTNPAYDVFYSRYQPAGWSAPAALESGSGSALNAASAMNPSGDAIAIWQQSDGTRDNIWANRYAVPVAAAGNNPPIANAGPDQTVTQNTSVTLNGSASSDPDGSIVSYAWRQVSGKAVSLSNPTAAIATFTAPRTAKPIDLVFELTVTDNKGATAVDQVTITVVK